MEISYWKSRWKKDKTGWQLNKVYPNLVKYWPLLSLPKNATVLVPLCGKSRDVLWLAEQGYRVIGIEASPIALRQLRTATGKSFSEGTKYGEKVYQSEQLSLWECDFFSLPPEALPPVDAVYDKASIVAMPAGKRTSYAQKLVDLQNSDTQFLIQTFEYEQNEMDGPPFSVPETEVRNLFQVFDHIEVVNERSMLSRVDKFRQRGLSTYFNEKVYHLF